MVNRSVIIIALFGAFINYSAAQREITLRAGYNTVKSGLQFEQSISNDQTVQLLFTAQDKGSLIIRTFVSKDGLAFWSAKGKLFGYKDITESCGVNILTDTLFAFHGSRQVFVRGQSGLWANEVLFEEIIPQFNTIIKVIFLPEHKMLVAYVSTNEIRDVWNVGFKRFYTAKAKNPEFTEFEKFVLNKSFVINEEKIVPDKHSVQVAFHTNNTLSWFEFVRKDYDPEVESTHCFNIQTDAIVGKKKAGFDPKSAYSLKDFTPGFQKVNSSASTLQLHNKTNRLFYVTNGFKHDEASSDLVCAEVDASGEFKEKFRKPFASLPKSAKLSGSGYQLNRFDIYNDELYIASFNPEKLFDECVINVYTLDGALKHGFKVKLDWNGKDDIFREKYTEAGDLDNFKKHGVIKAIEVFDNDHVLILIGSLSPQMDAYMVFSGRLIK